MRLLALAGRAAAAGDLGAGGEPAAEPAGRFTAGLRGQPRCALRRTTRIRRPQDPEKFIEALQERLREALTRFDTALELGTTGGVDIVKRHVEPWITVSPLGKQEKQHNLDNARAGRPVF